MKQYERYAVFSAPEPGPLASFGAAWLGWDPVSGTVPEPPQLAGLPRPVTELAATPRKYGLHATLKPPFRLAGPRAALEADLAALAARRAPVILPGLGLSRIGGFVALTPEGDTTALTALAAEAVMALDAHRAPAPPDETARRRQAGLSPRQDAHLARWGYPYVMDEFRFHLTLTGKLAPAEAEAVIAALGPTLTPRLPRPYTVGALCLFGEDAAGMFHLLHRYRLTG